VRAEGEKPPEESKPEVMAIDQPPELNLEDLDWRFPILEWLVEGKLPPDQTTARLIARRAKVFVLIDGELYKCGAADILMWCILGDQGHELLHEIHADTCGHHASPRTLVGKAFRQGFYWPTAVAESNDIDYGSPRVRAYTEEGNQVALEDAIDQLDEAHDVALLRSAKYQQALRRYHECNVRPHEFHIGDLMLRREGSKDRNKLSPPWEGPFIIHEVLRPGTYKIQCEDGRVVSNAWNSNTYARFILE
jgi:hypothetical protein